jgi:peptidoglycan hydrolase-like protein with peptidoglycan-binding domain
MVGSNFRAILRYNNSTNYALAVSLLASQLAGNGGVSAEWPRDLSALTREQTRALQTALSQRGFATGAAGVMGPATRAGLRQYPAAGLVATATPRWSCCNACRLATTSKTIAFSAFDQRFQYQNYLKSLNIKRVQLTK